MVDLEYKINFVKGDRYHMKVLVIGANGKVGKILVDKLQNSKNHTPIAMIRKESQQDFFSRKGISTVIGDLESSISSLANMSQQVDAVVFVAGSGGHTGTDKTIQIDLDSAVKSIEAAKQSGVNRFIMLSGMYVDRIHDFEDDTKIDTALAPYSIAKFYADEWLKNSGLNYTIIRPSHLTDEHGYGKIIAGDKLDYHTTSRENVALTILNSLENENTINKSFDMTDGEFEIEYALNNIN